MHPLVRALLASWDWRIDVTAVLIGFGILYVLGWIRLRSRSDYRKLASRRRLAAYLSGLIFLAMSLMSPIDRLGGQLFFMHMTQHMLSIMVAAPLICLGNPFPFTLWGLPRGLRRRVAFFFSRRSPVRSLLHMIANPGLAWFVFIAIYMGWHDPNLYNLALYRAQVHDLEHLTFFLSALWFWWHVTNAAPHFQGRKAMWSRLAMLVGVIPVQMVAGIIIATSPTVIYTYYATIPRFWGVSLLDDQAIGGMIMWTLNSEMVIWAAVFLLGGLFGSQRPLSSPLANSTKKERLVADALEQLPADQRAQKHWRQLAEERLHARHSS